jgi:hypothetical protein
MLNKGVIATTRQQCGELRVNQYQIKNKIKLKTRARARARSRARARARKHKESTKKGRNASYNRD